MKIKRKISFILVLILYGLFSTSCSKNEPLETNYNIEMEFDSSLNRFNCLMNVDWVNNSETSISEIPFHFLIDSTNSQLQSVKLNDQKCEFQYVTKDTHKFEGFIINPVKAIKPGQKVRIELDFNTINEENLRDNKTSLFFSEHIPDLQYFENGQFNPYYQNSENYHVTIVVPADYKVATSGIIVKEEIINGNKHLTTKVNQIPYYGVVLFEDIVVKELITINDILIRSFYFNEDSLWGNRLLEYADNVIRFYKDTIGFYPGKTLTIVPGYPKPYGGWPICPNVVGVHRGIDQKGDGAETHAEWITAHEIGHQYWGFNYILEPLDYPQWLGISMGIYTDRLYARKYNVAKKYNHFMYYYRWGVRQGYNTTIMQTVDTLNKQNFDWNNVIKHGKSFAVLDLLEDEIGENNFNKVFVHILNNYQGINVTLDMFKKACEEKSNQDLDWFFDQWYYTNDSLGYQVTDAKLVQQSDSIQTECTILKTGNAIASNVEIGFQFENGEMIIKTINGKDSSTKLSILTKQEIKKIIIDPHEKLPVVNKKNHEFSKD
ncbi:M1 family aminopeptidase [Bacteroidota bacterium]